MAFGKNLPPPMLATRSATLIVAAVVVVGVSGTWLPGAAAFGICLGLGSGINSIAQSALPLWLFGSAGYGAITGRMVAARLVAGALAPFVFSVLWSGSWSPPKRPNQAFLAACALSPTSPQRVFLCRHPEPAASMGIKGSLRWGSPRHYAFAHGGSYGL
ncbi:hypothetical protein ABIE78_002930 [Sinorhizobium fredii]|uniref:Putative major facilitator superfamily transporter n=1 Tax=Sinorhizobium fredii (strain USDA 257) TaxID=1185652 RepID=I3X5V5_SINF2|nr:putative major facilitator superfamily transporter [Sinorhizobium fredii USDA 257]